MYFSVHLHLIMVACRRKKKSYVYSVLLKLKHLLVTKCSSPNEGGNNRKKKLLASLHYYKLPDHNAKKVPKYNWSI